MNPLAFGTRERQLFGVFYPAGGERKRRAVVICPPLGQEYMRAHRAMRMLGDQLIASGYDVLRFDYYGTGDSGGAGEEVTYRGCVEDVLHAVEEAAALAGVSRVTLVGLRAGALVAAAALEQSTDVDRIVLWDPVTDGSAYVDALVAAGGGSRHGQDTLYAAGFPFSGTVRSELASLGRDAFAPVLGADSLLIVSDPEAHQDFRGWLEEHGWSGEYAIYPGPRSWEENADLGVGAVPVEILHHVARWEA